MEHIGLWSPAEREKGGFKSYSATNGEYVFIGFDVLDGGIVAPTNDPTPFRWVNNVLWGPQDNVSTRARLLGGSDQVTLYNGVDNWVNTNWDNDSIFLEGGYGVARGGIGKDQIQVRGGHWDVVNGNQGDDTIINSGYITGDLRGGAGNDSLTNFGGGNAYFYGDEGADTFTPWATTAWGSIAEGTQMRIKDFEYGIDTLDLSRAGDPIFVHDNGDTLIGSVINGVHVGMIAVVENILL